MARYRPGDIVLIAFPFTGHSGAKRRPALVLIDTGDADLVVARVTGQAAQTEHDASLADWEQAGLALPSVARLHKLATLDKRLVERKVGVLTEADWLRVRVKLRHLWRPLDIPTDA